MLCMLGTSKAKEQPLLSICCTQYKTEKVRASAVHVQSVVTLGLHRIIAIDGAFGVAL